MLPKRAFGGDQCEVAFSPEDIRSASCVYSLQQRLTQRHYEDPLAGANDATTTKPEPLDTPERSARYGGEELSLVAQSHTRGGSPE